MSDWQPIETAPKSGDTEFLAYGIARAEVSGDSDTPVMRVVSRWRPNGPIYESGGDYYSVEILATHWQPLPEPPQ